MESGKVKVLMKSESTRTSVRRSRALFGGTRRKADLKMESGKVKVIMKSESIRASVRRSRALCGGTRRKANLKMGKWESESDNEK